MRIIKINSFEAAEHFSSGSRARSRPWCIGVNDVDWDTYDAKGHDWYFLLISNGDKYAIDVNHGLVWDKRNQEVTLSSILNNYPEIEKYLRNIPVIRKELGEYLEYHLNYPNGEEMIKK